jgi:hypothetical protein
MPRHASARRLALAGICATVVALPFLPSTARAATTATSTDTLTLTAGSLAVAAVSAGSATAALGSVSPAAANLAVANWSDTTGSGAGWNGTMAVSLFNDTGAWTTTGGTHGLGVTGSGTYTGSATQGYYVVTVTSDAGGTSVNATVTGTESASISGGAHGSALAVGTKGVTITFAVGTTYSPGDQFTIHVGNLPASALVLGAGSTITANGTTAATAPAFTNSGATVTGGTATSVGSGVKFVTAALNTGMGSFQVSPNGTIAFDGNLDWAGSYTAQVSYSIVTGP